MEPGSIQESLKRLADKFCPAPPTGDWMVFIEMGDPNGSPYITRQGSHGETALEAINTAVGHCHVAEGWRVQRAWAARREHVAASGYATQTPDWMISYIDTPVS